MTATTSPAVQKLSESAQADLAVAIGHYHEAASQVRAIEAVMPGVHGLSEFLEAHDDTLKKLKEVLTHLR